MQDFDNLGLADAYCHVFDGCTDYDSSVSPPLFGSWPLFTPFYQSVSGPSWMLSIQLVFIPLLAPPGTCSLTAVKIKLSG